MPVSPKYTRRNANQGPVSPFATDRTSDGVEIRQGPLPLKPEELALLKKSYDFNCKLFVLNEQEDLEKYKEIMDKLVNKEFLPAGPCVGPEWNEHLNSYVVFIQWAKPYAEAPDEIMRRLKR